MYRAYQYRIYPNNQQEILINKSLGACRFIYNLALETKITAYKSGKKLSAIDLCYQLAELKKDVEWLKEVDSQALQASIKKVDVAYKSFFKGNGFPKFKSKKGRQSFQCPNNRRKVDWLKSMLSIPKIKNIPIALSRKFDGKIKTVTISKTPTNKYFASILIDTGIELPKKVEVKKETTIGIDLGINHFAITSNGEKFVNPQYLRASIERLKVLSRRANKKVKGSNNRKKANLKVALLHERITNQRKDFLHKLSSRLINESQVDTICLESLAVSNMSKNHKLALSIADVSWTEFVKMLKYKADWSGKNILQIGRFEPSSKTCSCCGYINSELKLSDREWTCINCLSIHDRDINAAKNIKFMGLQTGKGIPSAPVEMSVVQESMKQEVMPNKWGTTLPTNQHVSQVINGMGN